MRVRHAGLFFCRQIATQLQNAKYFLYNFIGLLFWYGDLFSEEKKMRLKNIVLIVMAGLAAWMYIRYQRIDIEIARFDCMMKVMKEEQRKNIE